MLCKEILSNRFGWISGLREKLKDKSMEGWERKRILGRLDPHNCQASCLTPDYGCDACTNTSYFRCPVNGEPHCLHPHLECDGHPQCDNKEDENGCPSSSTGLKSSNKEGHKLFFLICLIFSLIEISWIISLSGERFGVMWNKRQNAHEMRILVPLYIL